jgi:hypothetical protein
LVVNNIRIYKVKSDTTGDASRFKARLVAKGCSQLASLDCKEAFSPVIRMASLRLFIAIAAALDLELFQLDIDTTFIYASIQEDVYTRQPLGSSQMARSRCVISRCLYGLKHSPRELNMLMRAWLAEHG